MLQLTYSLDTLDFEWSLNNKFTAEYTGKK